MAEEDEIYRGINVGAFIGAPSDDDDESKRLTFSDGEREIELDADLEAADDEEEEQDEQQANESIIAAFADDVAEEAEYDDDDSEEAFMDAIRVANNFRTKRRKVDRRTARARIERELNPEVRLLLSNANELFVSNQYDQAEKLYLEVVKKDAKNFSAYKSLGEIYYRQGLLNKSCNSWFLAAHIDPLNGEFWASVAKLSKELGHTAQALYCYGRAINANYKKFSVLFERAILYRETNQIGRASESLQKLQKLYPDNPKVVKELAMIYVQLNRVNDAISMYLKIFEQNCTYRDKTKKRSYTQQESEEDELEGDDDQDPDSVGTKLSFPVFDWSCLNILAELLIKQKNYKIAIRTIKHAARWIQYREDETFWEDVADDSEFDERRYENSKFEALPDILKEKSHKLPIDIRVKLGTVRLYLHYTSEALRHYANYLLNEDVLECADLYIEAGTRLEEAQLFNEALQFYSKAQNVEGYNYPALYVSLAKCSAEIENYKDAKRYYEIALELNSNDVDIELSLVETLYYLGEVDQSQALLEKINNSRKIDELDNSASSFLKNKSEENSSDKLMENQALIINKLPRISKSGHKLTESERIERDEKSKQNVINKYKRLQKLYKGVEAGDAIAAGTWIRLASELIEIFSNVKNFFPKDRSRQFKGIITRTKGLQMDIDSKIERISQLYSDPAFKNEEKMILTSKEEFRGLKYSQWFDLFMEYALSVARYDNAEDANSIIDNAKNINVFYHDKERDEIMTLVKLSISLKIKESKDSLLALRVLLNAFQFNKYVLKLFLLCQPSGKICTENFISINHQKYFLRQIKAYDSIKLHGKSITGMATITNKSFEPDGEDDIYLLYIYASLLFTNRSYVPSLVYLTRIYKKQKNEPMINLVTGLAHIHRSMQRSSTNRHMELLQGLKYIAEYFELRTSGKFGELERQEALYNVGRIYHCLGLFTIAVEYYERVLKEFDCLSDEDDLKRHAAYNLVLIYNSSGNTRLSNSIMEKHLSV